MKERPPPPPTNPPPTRPNAPDTGKPPAGPKTKSFNDAWGFPLGLLILVVSLGAIANGVWP